VDETAGADLRVAQRLFQAPDPRRRDPVFAKESFPMLGWLRSDDSGKNLCLTRVIVIAGSWLIAA